MWVPELDSCEYRVGEGLHSFSIQSLILGVTEVSGNTLRLLAWPALPKASCKKTDTFLEILQNAQRLLFFYCSYSCISVSKNLEAQLSFKQCTGRKSNVYISTSPMQNLPAHQSQTKLQTEVWRPVNWTAHGNSQQVRSTTLIHH